MGMDTNITKTTPTNPVKRNGLNAPSSGNAGADGYERLMKRSPPDSFAEKNLDSTPVPTGPRFPNTDRG